MKVCLSVRGKRRSFSPFDQDTDGVCHELVGHFQNLVGKRGTDQTHLSGRREIPVHVINLLLKTWQKRRRQTFISCSHAFTQQQKNQVHLTDYPDTLY